MKIELTFDTCTLTAELFDNAISSKFFRSLPHSIELTTWEDEAYGSIGIDLGESDPVPTIPAGGIAYTNNGNYLCFFYGQNPAWPVEYIGAIDLSWEELRDNPPRNVTVSALEE